MSTENNENLGTGKVVSLVEELKWGDTLTPENCTQLPEDTNATDMAKRFQERIDSYKEYAERFNTQEELDVEEQKWIDELNKFDAYLKDRVYTLPVRTKFEGKTYNRDAIGGLIVQFIGKIEVDWQYTLGLYELCKLWRGNETNITYGALDSTLRILGQVKYKGEQQWRDINLINEYFKQIHEEYTKDNTTQIYLSQLHNVIISRRDLIDPVKPTETTEE